MRLSDLKALIAEIEAKKITEDPMIDFYVSRPEVQQVRREESEQFVNFDLDLNAIQSVATEHMVRHCAANLKTVYVDGDFTLPLIVAPFYKA